MQFEIICDFYWWESHKYFMIKENTILEWETSKSKDVF